MIFNWLTGAPDSQLSDAEEPLKLNAGRWILCGYGRFGTSLYESLREHNVQATILEADENICEQFKKSKPLPPTTLSLAAVSTKKS